MSIKAAKNDLGWFTTECKKYKARRDLLQDNPYAAAVEIAVCNGCSGLLQEIITDIDFLKTNTDLQKALVKYQKMDEDFVFLSNAANDMHLDCQSCFYRMLMMFTGRATLVLQY